MQFDVIIGNPPYQLGQSGGDSVGGFAMPIYQKFVQAAKSLDPRFVVMVTPSRWFTGGRGLDEFRSEMLTGHDVRSLVDHPNANDVFPGGVVWGNTNNGAGYDLVLLGQAEPTRIDVESVQRHLSDPAMAPVASSLGQVGMYSAIDLFSNYTGTKTDLGPWLADAAINRDRNLRLQYLAGMGFNLYQSEAIYADMLQYSQWPNDLFIGSDATKQQLRSAILRMQGKM